AGQRTGRPPDRVETRRLACRRRPVAATRRPGPRRRHDLLPAVLQPVRTLRPQPLTHPGTPMITAPAPDVGRPSANTAQEGPTHLGPPHRRSPPPRPRQDQGDLPL